MTSTTPNIFDWQNDYFYGVDRPPVAETDITLGYTRIVRCAPNVPTTTLELGTDAIERLRSNQSKNVAKGFALSMAGVASGTGCLINFLSSGHPVTTIGFGLAYAGFASASTMTYRLCVAEENFVAVHDVARSHGNHVFTELDDRGHLTGRNVPAVENRPSVVEATSAFAKTVGDRMREL
jgi:hypothetical protein